MFSYAFTGVWNSYARLVHLGLFVDGQADFKRGLVHRQVNL